MLYKPVLTGLSKSRSAITIYSLHALRWWATIVATAALGWIEADPSDHYKSMSLTTLIHRMKCLAKEHSDSLYKQDMRFKPLSYWTTRSTNSATVYSVYSGS